MKNNGLALTELYFRQHVTYLVSEILKTLHFLQGVAISFSVQFSSHDLNTEFMSDKI